MHTLLMILVLLLFFGLGYAVRGAIRRELAHSAAELKSWESRLEAALGASEMRLRVEAEKILGEIRAKL